MFRYSRVQAVTVVFYVSNKDISFSIILYWANENKVFEALAVPTIARAKRAEIIFFSMYIFDNS